MFLIAIIHLGGTKSAFILISKIEEDINRFMFIAFLGYILFSEQALLGYSNSCLSRLSTKYPKIFN